MVLLPHNLKPEAANGLFAASVICKYFRRGNNAVVTALIAGAIAYYVCTGEDG